ncbi:MAG: hypothetical protein ABJA98_22130 [Acidobacteriota bacterium]
MSKKKKSAPKAPTATATATPTDRRTFLGGLDPIALAELLDFHFSDYNESPYRKMIAETRTAWLAKDGPEPGRLYEISMEIDTFHFVEAAIRQSGFVVGFKACRELLLGDLDVDALKAELGGEQ